MLRTQVNLKDHMTEDDLRLMTRYEAALRRQTGERFASSDETRERVANRNRK